MSLRRNAGILRCAQNDDKNKQRQKPIALLRERKPMFANRSMTNLFVEDLGDGGVAVVEDLVDGAADEEGPCDCSDGAEG